MSDFEAYMLTKAGPESRVTDVPVSFVDRILALEAQVAQKDKRIEELERENAALMAKLINGPAFRAGGRE